MKLTTIRQLALALVMAALVASGAVAYAQVGGGFDLSWSAVSAGGDTFSTGGTYSLGGTIGRPDAGQQSGGAYTLEGSFWAGSVVTSSPTRTATGTRIPATITRTATRPPATRTSTRPPATRTSTRPPATSTAVPTYTPVPRATNTPVPASTNTPVPGRSNTPVPHLTNTPVPAATNTPVPKVTGTPLPARSATSTATACNLSFGDVRQADYFYQPVRYLACNGVISGYADGTFRPFNNTTRGQLSKIVVGAQGWTINTSGGPHFRDVPTNHTFYSFIETAFSRDAISGYADGTFRPFNNVTRGQLSKIVVKAEGWPPANPATPTFLDVPASNAFYREIETAVQHDIITGYDIPGGKAFRWTNNATRGQISKIVYLAIANP